MLERLAPEVDRLIREQMATGQYASENELIAQAIAALCRENQEVAAIQVGIDDMEAGRVAPLRKFDADFLGRNNISSDE